MLKDKAVLEKPMTKLISNLFQMSLKNIFTLPFFLPMGSGINGHCHKHKPKKRRLKFLRIFPSYIPSCNRASNQIWCCWQLGNLLLKCIRIGRILQEWIIQTVFLQFSEIQYLSCLLLFSSSYTREIILTQRSFCLQICWFSGAAKLMKPGVVVC